jgi:CHAT domain-containing protein
MSQLTDLERLLERRPLQRARAFLAVLVWCVRRGDVLTGRELLRRVSAMPEASALPSLRVRLAHARGLIAIASNEVEEAWTHLTSALHEVEHTRSGVRAEQLRASIVAQSLDVAADAVRVALASEPDDVASRLFVALESMRASTLLEACGGREQRAATNALDGGESSRDVVLLRQRLVGLYRRAEEGKASLSDVHDAEFALELATLRSASREHREIDAARSHESAGTTGQSSTRSEIASLQHAQRVLGDARIVVQFFREADAIGALVFTSRSARVLRSVWPLSLVVSASRRLALATDVLGTEAAPSMPTQLAELGEMLARALARCEVDTREDVAERAIAVVGCQELHALPVASLVARAARSAAAQVPSVWVGDALSKRASPALPPRVLSLGVSDRLAPHMVAEAHAVAQAWQHATTLTADNATSTAMLRELPQHDLVHLSTHCVFDGEFPMSSRVRLADRWVAARELFAVLRPGCVVVLAGCESGQSSGMMGEDRFGLVRAMLAGGASLVVASSWMLHDSSAAWLFPRLHTLLARRVHAAHAVAPERGRSGARAALSLASHTTLALHDVQQEAARDGLPWHRWQGVFAKGQLP